MPFDVGGPIGSVHISETEGRRYAGRSSSERRAERRARLLAAGLELFGTQGWAASPIERLCAEASVATRSFYEEFTGREALLHAVYSDITAGAARAIREALRRAGADRDRRVRAGLEAYVDYVTADPRRAQIVHQEVRRTAGVLEADRQSTMLTFADLIEREILPGVVAPGADPRLLAIGLAGSVNELMVDWTFTEPRPPAGPIVDALCALFLSLAASESVSA